MLYDSKCDKAVDEAIAAFDLFRREYGTDQLTSMIAGPCGYPPGQARKVAVLYWRYKLGLDLFVDGDSGFEKVEVSNVAMKTEHVTEDMATSE